MKQLIFAVGLLFTITLQAQEIASVFKEEVKPLERESKTLEKGEVESLQSLKQQLATMKKENYHLKQVIQKQQYEDCSKINQTSHDGLAVTQKVLRQPKKGKDRNLQSLPPPL